MGPIRYAVIAVAITLVGAANGARAHIPEECAPYMFQSERQVEIHSDSLEELHRLSEAEISLHLVPIQRAFSQSLDVIEAATAGVICAMEQQPEEAAPLPHETPPVISASAEPGDWQTLLDETLAFAEEHEDALKNAERRGAAFYETVYGKPSTAGSFLDVVTEWAHAKREGNQTLADAHLAVMESRVKHALDVQEQMHRHQIAEREQWAFSCEYVEQCRAAGIRELASQ